MKANLLNKYHFMLVSFLLSISFYSLFYYLSLLVLNIIFFYFPVISFCVISFMSKSQLLCFLLALLLVCVSSQIVSTQQNKVHLFDSAGNQIHSTDLNLEDKSLAIVRKELEQKLGSTDFTFMKPIRKEDEGSIMGNQILEGSVIIVVKDRPNQFFDNLMNLIPKGSTVIYLPQNSTQIIPKPQQGTVKVETIKYSQGIYVGETVNGIRNGKGQFCFDSGDCYEGQWAQDKWNGQGTYTFADSSSVSGQWLNGELIGTAIFKYPNGNVYEGSVTNYAPNGKGQLVTKTYKYTGDFMMGSITGVGKFEFTAGSQKGNVYVGQVKDGRVEGRGRLTSSSGNSYQGEWLNNKRNGYGIQYQGDQISYEGEWKDDKYNGEGTYYDLKNSLKLQGTFLEGQLHGKIVITKKDGTKLEKAYNRGEPI